MPTNPNNNKVNGIKPIGNDTPVTDMEIRILLRDTDPEANILLDDYEYSPEEIRTAMNMAVDYWNDQPPNIGFTDYDKFPYRSKLTIAVASILLSMAAHKFRRNSVSIQAGGTVFADQDKAQQYDAASARLWEEYKQWVRMKKREINSNMGWGWA